MSIRWALDGPEMAQIVVKSIYSPELAGWIQHKTEVGGPIYIYVYNIIIYIYI